MSRAEAPENAAAAPAPGLFRRWRSAWRDRRLEALGEREFCRRISLEGWSELAAATASGQGFVVAVGGELPRAAARALRLYAGAKPLAEAGAGAPAGAVVYAAMDQTGSAAFTARGESAGSGARIRILPHLPSASRSD